MKLTQILSEVEFMTYEGMVQIVYEDSDANEIGYYRTRNSVL